MRHIYKNILRKRFCLYLNNIFSEKRKIDSGQEKGQTSKTHTVQSTHTNTHTQILTHHQNYSLLCLTNLKT